MIGNYLQKQLNELRLSDCLCDLELVSNNGISFKVHHAVFLAVSHRPFDKFNHELIDAVKRLPSSTKKMFLSKMSANEVLAVVEFMYGLPVQTKKRYDCLAKGLEKLSMLHLIEEVGGFTFGPEEMASTRESVEIPETTATNVDQNCPRKVEISSSVACRKDNQGISKEKSSTRRIAEKFECGKTMNPEDLDKEMESFIKKEIDEIFDRSEQMEDIHEALKRVKEKVCEYDHAAKLNERGGYLATAQNQVDSTDVVCDKTTEVDVYNNALGDDAPNGSSLVPSLQELKKLQNQEKRVKQLQINLHCKGKTQTLDVPALSYQDRDTTSRHSGKTMQTLLNIKQTDDNFLKNDPIVANKESDRLTEIHTEKQAVQIEVRGFMPFTQNTNLIPLTINDGLISQTHITDLIPLSQKSQEKISNDKKNLPERESNDTGVQHMMFTDGIETDGKGNSPLNSDDYEQLHPSMDNYFPATESVSAQPNTCTNFDIELDEQQCPSHRISSDTSSPCNSKDNNIKYLTMPVKLDNHNNSSDTGKSPLTTEIFINEEKLSSSDVNHTLDSMNYISAENSLKRKLDFPQMIRTSNQSTEMFNEKPEIEAFDLIAEKNQQKTIASDDNKFSSGEKGISKSSSKVNVWRVQKPDFGRSMNNEGMNQVISNKGSCKRKDIAYSVKISNVEDHCPGGSETDNHSVKKAKISSNEKTSNNIHLEGKKTKKNYAFVSESSIKGNNGILLESEMMSAPVSLIQSDLAGAKVVEGGTSCNIYPPEHSYTDISCSTPSVFEYECKDAAKARECNSTNTIQTDTLMVKKITETYNTTWSKVSTFDKSKDILKLLGNKSVSVKLFRLPDNMKDVQFYKTNSLNKFYQASQESDESCRENVKFCREAERSSSSFDRSKVLETSEKTANFIVLENENNTGISKNIAKSGNSEEKSPVRNEQKNGFGNKVTQNEDKNSNEEKIEEDDNESSQTGIEKVVQNGSVACVENRSNSQILSPKKKHIGYETLKKILSTPVANSVSKSPLPRAKYRPQPPVPTEKKAQRKTSTRKLVTKHRKCPWIRLTPVSTLRPLRPKLPVDQTLNEIPFITTFSTVEKFGASTPLRRSLESVDTNNSFRYGQGIRNKRSGLSTSETKELPNSTVTIVPSYGKCTPHLGVVVTSASVPKITNNSDLSEGESVKSSMFAFKSKSEEKKENLTDIGTFAKNGEVRNGESENNGIRIQGLTHSVSSNTDTDKKFSCDGQKRMKLVKHLSFSKSAPNDSKQKWSYRLKRNFPYNRRQANRSEGNISDVTTYTGSLVICNEKRISLEKNEKKVFKKRLIHEGMNE